MLGLIGGGQLGRMFTMAAKTMGYRVMVLEPDPKSPAGSIADVHLCAPYDDPTALETLARESRAVTTEFENVPASVLDHLAQWVRVAPPAAAVSIAQDRLREKAFLTGAGLEVAPYLAVEGSEALERDLSPWLPGLLKVARFGYDGKGQRRVTSREEVQKAFRDFGEQACVLERQLELEMELSVIVARTGPGELITYPVAENQHVNGILDLSLVPARITEEIAARAQHIALTIVEALNYIGVMGVELFVTRPQTLMVNEIAPRPHNSGHFTLDATLSSQFDQQVRTLCGWPPLEPRLLSAAAMINLLGDLWGDSEPDWSVLANEPRALLHLYGKEIARPGRKMGHINLLADNVETALLAVRALQHALPAKASSQR